MALVLPAGAAPIFPAAAGVPATVMVSSAQALATQVGNWQGNKTWAPAPAKAPTTVAGDFPAGSVEMVGVDMLQDIGTATTPVGAQSPLGPAHSWALLRYHWAIDRSAGGFMCLSPGALDLRYHHRQAISEYLGVGIAIQIVRCLLNNRFPGAAIDFVDAEQALAFPGAIPALNALGGLRPDYFVTIAGGPLIVVECKGATSSNGRVISLAKAMRQLHSVTYQGVNPIGFAIHTAFADDGFESAIFDPEGDDLWAVPAATGRDRSVSGRASENGPEILDPASFRAEIEDLAQSSLLWWSGAEAAALSLLPSRVRDALPIRSGSDAQAVSVNHGGQTYQGIEMTIPVGGATLSYFRGVDNRYRQLLMAKARGDVNLTEVADARRRLGRTSTATSAPQDPESSSSTASHSEVTALPTNTEIIAIGDNGAMSRLAVT